MYIPWGILKGVAFRQWKVIAAVLVVLAAYLYGHATGTSRQRALMEKEKLAQYEQWQQQSKKYQQEIALQRRKVQQKQKEVNDAIRLSYSSCVANHDIVRLWQEAYGSNPR